MVSATDIGYESLCNDDPTVVKNNGFIFSIAVFMNNHFFCSGCGNGILRVWDVQDERPVMTCNDHAGNILTLVIYKNLHGGLLFSWSRDCPVKFWLWDSGDRGFSCKRTLRCNNEAIVFLDIADNKVMSGSADSAI